LNLFQSTTTKGTIVYAENLKGNQMKKNQLRSSRN